MSTDLAPFVQPLTEDETNRFLEKLWHLLAEETERYTMGDSTSVPAETAQELLASISFTLCLEMEVSRLSPLDLLEKELNAVFKNGQGHLAEKVQEVKALWERVYALAGPLGSTEIAEALGYIKTYLKKYDFYFFAHQTPWDMGLPLLGPDEKSARGIFYAEMYLNELLSLQLNGPLCP